MIIETNEKLFSKLGKHIPIKETQVLSSLISRQTATNPPISGIFPCDEVWDLC